MFDEGTKIAVFAVVLGAWVFGMADEQSAPRPNLATVVDSAQLPPLPLTASSDGSPAQDRLNAMWVTLGDGFEAKLLTSYVIEGLVVTRREFRHDLTSAISPLDLGIVWGDLAEPGGIDDIEFRAGHRAIWFSPSPGADLPRDWSDQVTNNHLIPANQMINNALMAITVGSRVRVRGYLVKVTGDQIAPWRSSTRRDDGSIVGGCEIILVTDVDVLQDGGKAA
ncbi:hypothetical protein [Marivita sp.]|uniref:hypothetical protein n=1 Tax=Marivita sp. TaxID=2003365 RepID=UPI003F6D3A1A